MQPSPAQRSQRTCSARRPGDWERSSAAVNAFRAKRFGLPISSDRNLVYQTRAVGSRPKSRLVPPQAGRCCACLFIPPLVRYGDAVTDETLLLRQIHPVFIQNDRVTSQAFRPTPKDHGQLSVYDGDMISAEESWKHHTGLGLESEGVLAVTVRECEAESLPGCGLESWHAADGLSLVCDCWHKIIRLTKGRALREDESR
jgi:hypothetical protein